MSKHAMLTQQRKDPTVKIASSKGFTLFEMILTVAVMAILVATTTPSIYEFIRQRDKQNEEIAQMQVRKALEAYIADNGAAPADMPLTGTTAWFNRLAAYGNLSANEIANDVWGNPRTYIAFNDTSRSIYGTAVSVSYVTLHSLGEDGQAANSEVVNGATVTIPGIAVKIDNNGRRVFNGSSNGSWWKAQTDKAGTFAQVRAADDDQMMRYTNYDDVRQRYEATRQRLEKLTEALETYARTEYAAHVDGCKSVTTLTPTCNSDGTPRAAIYYPKSIAVTATGDSARYVNKGNLYVDEYVDNRLTNPKDRREQMEKLMTELGLPLEYCCSALDMASDSKPRPFYYFSNPRPRLAGGGCGPRRTVDEAKLPARITTTNTSDTCG